MHGQVPVGQSTRSAWDAGPAEANHGHDVTMVQVSGVVAEARLRLNTCPGPGRGSAARRVPSLGRAPQRVRAWCR